MTDLTGTTVLVPRGGAWGERVSARVRARGGTPWVVALLETTPVTGPDVVTAQRRLATGTYDWLVVTSAATVDLVRGWDLQAKVAAVGPATASTLTEAGIVVDLVPDHTYSATGLLQVWPDEPAGSSVLLLRSDLARASLADGLRERGCEVTDVIGYRTTAAPVDDTDAARIRAGHADAALVTSGSMARALAALCPAPDTVVASIGPVTTADARDAGLPVHAEASERTIDHLLDALCDAVGQAAREEQS
ncbi:uroporphyrinogen-III synthase [Ruania alba]|uniref:Uroporphyrinogen-III synthase n=1 Tax=Ruania alba TaxID=648782 RepID=A0A1H5HUY2_9MICO|nr:uroporphyrinogen-III synthase [Ruania alba]SEE31511.1 uroporphyrinogen III methyltransferase / synthase [Ruania alba]